VEDPYLVCRKRLNGVLRDHLNALTRKTHTFAKHVRTWDALVTLCLFEHNWLRPPSGVAGAGGGPSQGPAISKAHAAPA